MLKELAEALNDYDLKWRQLVGRTHDKAFFNGLKPVAVGWKVSDEQEYAQLYQKLRPDCDRIVETWMNGRWIAKMHLKNSQLPAGIEIVKLMQRRPGSSDALGLDHVDFYSPTVTKAEAVLQTEKTIKWSRESNDVVTGYEWLSVWFSGTEAKLKDNTVVDIVIQELQEINDKIRS